MMTFWWIAGAFALVLVVAVTAFVYISDKRYLKKKTSETFSPTLREEIEEERKYSLARHEKFEEALKTAKVQGDKNRD
jgi:hypothetical protein